MEIDIISNRNALRLHFFYFIGNCHNFRCHFQPLTTYSLEMFQYMEIFIIVTGKSSIIFYLSFKFHSCIGEIDITSNGKCSTLCIKNKILFYFSGN